MKNGFLSSIKGDFSGGIVSAVVALPQALAFGVATGLGASSGVWGAVILCFVAGILGCKTPMISGPTGPVAIVVAALVAANFGDMNSVFLVLFMASIIQIIISLTDFPNVVKYIPYPVISGFMNGVGMILILMQLNPLFGKKAVPSVIESIKAFVFPLEPINIEALILGLLTLFIIFIIPKKIGRFIPPQILALVFCTLLSLALNFDVERISEISINFPSLLPLNADFGLIYKMFPAALTLAVVCTSESLLTGLVADSLLKERTDRKRLVLAQGFGNLVCAATGSLSGSAATMRTVAALHSGATTKAAAIINPLILLIFLFTCGKFTEAIPLSVLAGILIKVGFDIIDMKLLRVVKYAPKDDLYVLVSVFLLTVFYNLIFAVATGIVLAALLYAKRVADRTSLVEKTYEISKDELELEKEIEKVSHHKIRVVHIDGHFFFGSATQIVSRFDEELGTEFLIINYESNAPLDISAVFALEDIIIRLQAQQIKLMLVINNPKVIKQLKNLNITPQIGEEFLFQNETAAIECAKELIKYTAFKSA